MVAYISLNWHQCMPSVIFCRYMSTTSSDYWKGDIEVALQPHPVVTLSATNLSSPFMTT